MLGKLAVAVNTGGHSIQENQATVKLDSNLASRGMKTYSKSRIELRNLQILKKMLDKSCQFL